MSQGIARTIYSVSDIYDADSNSDDILNRKEAKSSGITKEYFNRLDEFDGHKNNKVDLNKVRITVLNQLHKDLYESINIISEIERCNTNKDHILDYDEAAAGNFSKDLFNRLDEEDGYINEELDIQAIESNERIKSEKIKREMRDLIDIGLRKYRLSTH